MGHLGACDGSSEHSFSQEHAAIVQQRCCAKLERALTSESTSARRRPRLPLAVQGAVVVVAGVALLLVLVAAPAALRAASAHPDVGPPAAPAGTFRATEAQWRGLGFARAASTGFADQVSTSGRIALDEDASVQVTPPFSGRVVAVLAKAGDRVARGQVLLSAEASEVAQARSDLAAAQAALTTAKAQGEVAITNAARQQALFKINGAALKDVQQAQSDATNARDTLNSDEAALTLVRARLDVLQANGAIPSGRALGGGALATVRAPIAGVVTQRQVGPGQYLNATSNGATTAIFTVSDLSRVWLSADVREEDAARLHVGAPVSVRVSGLPGRVFHARLDYVAPALDPATRRLVVRATIANPDGALRPEMFADFAVDAGPSTEALGVPSSAVIYEGDTARVWVAGPGHALGLRQIRAGRTQGGEVEVLGGLNPGDRVVTSGAIFIDRAAKSD